MDGRTQPGSRLKQVWLAVNLSMLCSGLGLIYAGKRLNGLIFGFCQVAVIVIVGWSIFSAAGNTALGLSLILPMIFIYVVSLFETYRSINGRSILEAQQELRDQPDPWFAVFLSQILPGLGHLYAKKLSLSLVLSVSTLLCLGLSGFFPVLLVIAPVLSAIACYHVYVSFPRRFRSTQNILLGIVATTLALRLILGAAPALARHYVEPFTIPSGSMIPTLQVGDRIFVEKSSRYVPKQGDLVVFRPPQGLVVGGSTKSKFYVKRIIGEPGQAVQVNQGTVYINAQPVQESYIAEPPAYQWGPVTVPEHAYVVLGDNRNNSFDSHVWGFLPEGNVVGKAYKIYWPPSRIRALP